MGAHSSGQTLFDKPMITVKVPRFRRNCGPRLAAGK
jgi:hypothetical protein